MTITISPITISPITISPITSVVEVDSSPVDREALAVELIDLHCQAGHFVAELSESPGWVEADRLTIRLIAEAYSVATPSVPAHAVDAPGKIADTFNVPTCLPTVNPHGLTKPAAPGNGGQGQNQDGFYEFGSLPFDQSVAVFIRDDVSGVVFGPFPSGTKIKWVEANGATPSITPMGGNNGNGKGQANAVDYQIRAQGDAVAFVIDERGIETSISCRVPPFPQ